MEPCRNWHKTFDIDAGAISEADKRLFQMNIYEQSLFPDRGKPRRLGHLLSWRVCRSAR